MWGFVDEAICITVDGSARIEEFVNDCHKVGLSVEMRKFPKVKRSKICNIWDMMQFDNSCCETVCQEITRSHLQLIKEAYEKGNQNLLIFEDDARWVEPFDIKQLHRTLDWVAKHDYDIFFLGYFNVFGSAVNKDIVKLRNPLLSHAYIINRSGMARVIQDYEMIVQKHIAIDHYFAFYTQGLNKFGAYPCLSAQCDAPLYYAKAVEKLGLESISFSTFTKLCNSLTYGGEYLTATSLLILVLFAIILILIIKWFAKI